MTVAPLVLLDLDGTHLATVSRTDTLNLLPAWSTGGGALLWALARLRRSKLARGA